MKKICYLDMDGVIADFEGGLRKHFKNMPVVTNWDISKCWGITDAEMWSVANQKNFWLDLEPLPWIDELCVIIETFGYEIVICTSPSCIGPKFKTPRPDCVYEKMAWLDMHDLPYRAIITSAGKSGLAGSGILIDDSESNVYSFRDNNGQSILFPSTCNRNACVIEHNKNLETKTKILDYISEQLSKYG